MMILNINWKRLVGTLAGATFVCSAFSFEIEIKREDAIDLKIPLFENGASPGWNSGAPMLARKGDRVWFTLSRPVEGEVPYANIVWQLYELSGGHWNVVYETTVPTEREPCPVALLDSERLAVFVNPKVAFLRERDGNNLWRSRPHLITFPLADLSSPSGAIDPEFAGSPLLREHTYRGFSVNSKHKEIFLMVQDPDTEVLHPSYRDATGKWLPLQPYSFPIRGLYPILHIQDKQAHVLAVSDIREPVKEWEAAKYEVFQRHWDFAYRHIYYTWSADVTKGRLEPSVLLDHVEDRPGYLRNLDLLVDPDGTAHALYIKNDFQYAFLRDRFFPEEPMNVKIEYVQIRAGKIVERHTLAKGMKDYLEQEADSENFLTGRFHRLADGSVAVVYSGVNATGNFMRVALLDQSGTVVERRDIPMETPFTGIFFTNTERGGSAPSNTIDMVELNSDGRYHSVRYAQIRIVK